MNKIQTISDMTDETKCHDNLIGLYGIVDDHGIDQMYRIDDDEQADVRILQLRCMYNSHRNARLFCCIISKTSLPKTENALTLYYELKTKAIAFAE